MGYRTVSVATISWKTLKEKKMPLPWTVGVFVVLLVASRSLSDSRKASWRNVNDLFSQYDEIAVKIKFFKIDFHIITTLDNENTHID